jgi:transposase-like protein
MISNTTLCFKYVDDYTICLKCDSYRVKNGKTLGGKQCYFCSQCKSSKVLFPQVICFGDKFNQQVAQLCIEGCGIRSIARILNI